MWLVTYTLEGNPHRSLGVTCAIIPTLQVEDDQLLLLFLFFFEAERRNNKRVELIYHL